MIEAKFYKQNGLYSGFIVSGHAGGAYGQDIVCAAVSSAVMLTVNTVTDFFDSDVTVKVCENKIGLKLRSPYFDREARAMVFSLHNHLELLAQENEGINVIVKDC